MARSSKVVAFSLPPELLLKLNALSKNTNLTRSQFLRQLLDIYESTGSPESDKTTRDPSDLAYLFQTYWNLKAKTHLDVQVVGLAMIHNADGQILIGSRAKDDVVANLTWSFPGGRLESLQFDAQLGKLVLDRTGYAVTVRNLVSARLFPEVTLANTQVVALYFDCVIADTRLAAVKEGKFTELKWVAPMDVFKYFTSSTSDEITK